MEVSKIYSKKSFGIITIFALLISACINVGLYFKTPVRHHSRSWNGGALCFLYAADDTGRPGSGACR